MTNPTKTKTVTAKEVASEFSKVLHRWLTKEEMTLVVARNAAETRSGICHSHDFCDANMAMDEAFNNLGLESLPSEEEHPEESAKAIALWNEAWAIAQAAQFDASKIV